MNSFLFTLITPDNVLGLVLHRRARFFQKWLAGVIGWMAGSLVVLFGLRCHRPGRRQGLPDQIPKAFRGC